MAVRRTRIDADDRDSCLVELASLMVEIDPLSDARVWTATALMSEVHGLTVYDASYVELAVRRQLPVASLDRALTRAAATEGLATLGL